MHPQPGADADGTPRFRPIVDLTDGTVVGVDAGGPAGPLGLLAAASAHADRARGSTPPDLFMTPHAVLWERGDVAEVLAHVVRAAGLDPTTVVVGLDPSAATSPADLRVALDRLAVGGIRVAVEGFGRSSASFRWLRELPLSVARLHRDLLVGVTRDDRVVRMLVHLAAIARDLGLDAVAEGVDDPDTADLVRIAGIRLAVGAEVGDWSTAPDVEGDPRPPVVDLRDPRGRVGPGDGGSRRVEADR